MIDKKLLSKIKKDLETYQSERNRIIGDSRGILQNSKKAIFALHKGDKPAAAKYLAEAEKGLNDLDKAYNEGNRLRFEGSYKASVEEYVEAKMFSLVLENKDLSEIPMANIGPEEYIGGMADTTGEMVRQAVLQATEGNTKELKRYKAITEEIVGFLLGLYLTGHLRQKFDEVKRNLRRLEQIIYETETRK